MRKKIGRFEVWAWLLIAFGIFYVVTSPDDAAELVRRILDAIAAIANGFRRFVTETIL